MAVQDSHLRLESRLKAAGSLLLDGAMGTVLSEKGMDVSLPLWSAAVLEENPSSVLEIHRQYIEAGAEILTANTFRTTPRTFFKVAADWDKATRRAKDATFKAVVLAKEAAAKRRAFVAGSIAPLEDCYSPELFPGFDVALSEFGQLGRWLAEAEVDLLLLETMPCIDEAKAALQATSRLGCPRWVSFIVQTDGILLSGEPLEGAVATAEKNGADVVLVNCSDLEVSVKAIERVMDLTSLPTGLYPNLGKSPPTREGVFREKYDIDEFAAWMGHAVELGVKVVGSCCGSSAVHTRRLRELINHLE